MTEDKPKKKAGVMGRPKGATKEKKGAMIWVQSEFVDTIKAMLETLRQQHQKQAAS
jgi:hypothetical protein